MHGADTYRLGHGRHHLFAEESGLSRRHSGAGHGYSANPESQAFLSRRISRHYHRRGAPALGANSMMQSSEFGRPPVVAALLAGMMCVGGGDISQASDHLDTPTVIANPQADIGDVYAWTSPNGRQLNLVMTILGHTFSDRLQSEFHVERGQRVARTPST